MLYPLSYERNCEDESTTSPSLSLLDPPLLPGPPTVVAAIDLERCFGIRTWVEELVCAHDAKLREPLFVPAVIDLEQPVATLVGYPDHHGIQLALPPGDRNRSLLEFVWPHLTNDLNHFFRGKCRRRRRRLGNGNAKYVLGLNGR
jgi:hypothetical protein